MNNYIITKPSIEPITLAQAKAHLNIDSDFTDDDAIIDLVIQTAREAVENKTGRKLITTTMGHQRDCFSAVMGLPHTVQSVTEITYVDTDGATQTLANTEYELDVNRAPGRVMLAYGKTYPSTRNKVNAVTIKYVTGFGDNAQDVPSALQHAMLLLIGHYYENREATAPININTIPMSVEFLLNPYRIYNL
jgi:uncharacterized phiE125 gp8 family phage protein